MTQNFWDNFQTDINEPFESYLFKGTFIKKLLQELRSSNTVRALGIYVLGIVNDYG